MSALHEPTNLADRARRTEAADRIKARALQLGFQRVGIVGAETLSPEGAHLKEWLARGYQGEMGWMARDPEQRADPRKFFPGARSVVVVAANYYTPSEHSDHPDTGKVSRYAWGDDYHEIVGDKLRALLTWTQRQWPEAEGKVCVDIQPMMDKAWAQRAGLGWIGKHTNLITEEYGSWVFIGELLLNIELEYDRAIRSRISAVHARSASMPVPPMRSSNLTCLIQTGASRTLRSNRAPPKCAKT